MKKLLLVFISIGYILLSSCNSEPVKVEPLNASEKKQNIQKTHSENMGSNISKNMDEGVHKVIVVDSLATSRYVYLKVKEGSKDYWISTWKMPFEKGDVFYYKGGILKLNFYSKEHNTFFDTLYLVSKISKKPVFTKTSALDKVDTKVENAKNNDVIKNGVNKEDIVKLKDLYANPEKYKGKIIKIGGKCTKANINIMGKNWIHIQEKDSKGEAKTLVVTSMENANVGEDCYFEGKIETKLDLGAGYFFEVIMQEGKRIY